MAEVSPGELPGAACGTFESNVTGKDKSSRQSREGKGAAALFEN